MRPISIPLNIADQYCQLAASALAASEDAAANYRFVWKVIKTSTYIVVLSFIEWEYQ